VGHGHVHAIPIDERLTPCDDCGQQTRTLGALCEGCSAVKDRPDRAARGFSTRMDFDAGLGWILWYVPALVLLGIAVFGAGSTELTVAALALMIAPLLWQIATGGDDRQL
jgi:hypothetical protein